MALLSAVATPGVATPASSVAASAVATTRRPRAIRTLWFLVPLVVRSLEAAREELITTATIAYRPDTGPPPR